MINKNLPQYEDFPLVNQQDLNNFSNKTVYYDELVVSTDNFSHPGSNLILQSWIKQDIEKVFENQTHSFNAKLMLLNLVIGRRSQKRGKGYELYTQIKSSKMSQIHQKLMSQLDLSFGLLNQIEKRTPQEIQAFVVVPKYFNNANQIMFKQTKWQDFLYRERFWLSTIVFTIIFFLVTNYLYQHSALLNDLTKICSFLLGILAWTAIEYYFHRIVLHTPFKTGMHITSHYIHHAFPNLKNKLALTISKNMLIIFVVYLIGIYIIGFNRFNFLNFLLGLHFFMTLYDLLHYYFHFGPDTSIPILNALKKNHMKHHFRDSNRGFGVTTRLWDWVFGTQHIK